jgi:hypothetical protein
VRWRSVAASSVALSAACQGDDWIVAGELPSDMGSPSEPRDAAELVSDPGACPSSLEVLGQRAEAFGVASVADDHVGRWRGVLGTPAGFPSPDVTLEVDASGAGTLLFGASTSAPFPFDSEAGYLCSAEAMRVVCGSVSGFVGGFAYPIAGARSHDGVLSFVIVTADPWASWCAEREPLSWEDSNQACGFGFGVLPDAELRYSPRGCTRATRDGVEAIDCALMYALNYCQCARDGCFARFDWVVEVALALSQDGAALGGSLWYETGASAAEVELTRAP